MKLFSSRLTSALSSDAIMSKLHLRAQLLAATQIPTPSQEPLAKTIVQIGARTWLSNYSLLNNSNENKCVNKNQKNNSHNNGNKCVNKNQKYNS